MGRQGRQSARNVRQAVDQTRKKTQAADYFPPAKKGVLSKVYRDPRTA